VENVKTFETGLIKYAVAHTKALLDKIAKEKALSPEIEAEVKKVIAEYKQTFAVND